ncbi:thioesterase family protein [Iamia majanohamensis]|uniref:Thioesterase family protein n=1 Tax=Iamia majanohamensis TaxID=467976 RepID=A0AAF0BVG7_9ACTN|nr:thioesterase family protein [Iamia majanohamensis]WCO67013.1 thioesterase family protein [Iamia majanohamensis]
MDAAALFRPDGDAFVSTDLTQGGWDPRHANGAAVLALLGHCLEDVPTLVPMTLSRLTVDLVRPVPLGPRLQVTAEVVREGKKIQVVEQRVAVDDVVHVRATALRLRDAADAGAPTPRSTTDARPADALVDPEGAWSFSAMPDAPGFLRGIDLRRAPRTDGAGVGAWLRLQVPVVAGEEVRATARAVVGFDFANLVGVDDHPEGVTMINPDVTGHVLRSPVEGWIAVTGDTRFAPGGGRGLSTAMLSDAEGVFAVVSVSQLVQARR